ncbi:response regulator [Noviherbaspirillum sp. L7-7A]|uniref:ATP-binding response regulator n=1 Tax=Noviherbaspirillum sp. L7-7A TaxID=2850560 RepID=UPI001C2C6C02|nr:ATP-binding protein [Noviherbaspirillum sp. L7-7A]MBV0882004.1 response regulator [Noviherbaspirillum sp. L7-7A]
MANWLNEISEKSSAFMPHGHCYLWIPSLLWMHVVSDALIGTAYLGISLVLYLLVRRIRLPFSPVFIAFGLFIGLCGLTHFMKIWTVWHPDYLLDGLVKVATAAASVATAIGLLYVRPQIEQTVAAARLSEERRVELERAHTELEALYRKVKELDEIKTQFFANVSHELRTPLTLMLGPAERMREDASLNQQQRRELDLISRNGRSLLRHVNDLLDIAKLESHDMQPQRTRFDLQPWLTDIAAQFEQVASQRGLRFDVAADEAMLIEADPDMIERVVINLLSNAVKFTPAGGEVRLRLARGDGNVVITVADSGPGIAEEARELIFERFRQADGSITRQYGGTGLGLAIVKDLVSLHGGSVKVDASAAGGARFTVQLPLTAGVDAAVQSAAPAASPATRLALSTMLEELAPAAAAEQPEAPLPQRPSVLVVEDNQDMRRFLAETLAPYYNVVTAADGQEGYQRFQALQPDLVVSDIMMPLMSGEQLVKAIRSSNDAPAATPILLLSAKADDALRVKLLREGAQDYLTKPFLPQELLARAANLIAAKRAGDQLRGALASASLDIEGLASELVTRHRQLETTRDAAEVAREQAERANRVKGLFLGMVSHELRTPIATMDMNVQLLERGGGLPTPATARLQRMARATRQLAGLVESLLEYTRLESGRIEARPESLDAAAIVQEVLSAHADQAASAVTLSLEPQQAAVPPIVSDARLLRIVLANLISNALKFTSQGSVTVRLMTEHDTHVFEVADTGQGIDEADTTRIFQPFERLEPVQHKSLPGVGLGLALVDQIVRALGGRITVSSRLGQGSRFRVHLPSRGACETLTQPT